MPSLKSKMFNFMMRNRHWFQGKLKRDVFNENTSIPDFRDLCEKSAAKYAQIPEGINIHPEILGGIKAEWVIPAGSNPERMIFYVHGGGYVSGSCADHRGFVSKFAKTCGVINLVYEYRLAPEHPFPAALDDSIAVYTDLLSKGRKPENIVIAGESAGGGLTLAILLALKERRLPFPAAAVAISPWTDLTCSGESYKTKNKVSVAPLNSWTVFSRHYAGSTDVRHDLISPLFGDLTGLPPIFINSGKDDELFDDGERFYHKAKASGVDITFMAGEGMVHCYPLLAPFFPEATFALNEICKFIKMQLKL